MQNALYLAQLISIIMFAGYGATAFFSNRMRREFERYGHAKNRKLISSLQVCAAIGQLVGFWWPPILIMVSTGLSLMMACAVGVRFKIKDSFAAKLPALLLCLLNAFIVVGSIAQL